MRSLRIRAEDLLIYVALIFALFRNTTCEGFKARNLHENTDRSETVVATSLAELNHVWDNLEPNMTIVIEVPEIHMLRKTVIINVPGVTIRGRRSSRPIFSCSGGTSESAFIIRGVSTRFESLRFKSCNDASAVRVETKRRKRDDPSTFSVTFIDVTFSGNGAEGRLVNGSAIHVAKCTAQRCLEPHLHLKSSKFRHNRGECGGAIYLGNAGLTIADSLFVNNSAAAKGGAIHHCSNGSDISIRRTTFRNNRIILDVNRYFLDFIQGRDQIRRVGGVLSATNPRILHIQKSHFEGNSALTSGGCIVVRMCNMESSNIGKPIFRIEDSYFRWNSVNEYRSEELNDMDIVDTTQFGGGVVGYYADDEVVVDWLIKNSTFVENVANYGGALYLEGSSELNVRLESCELIGNNATGGGAITVNVAKMTIHSSVFRGNHALWGAGLNFAIGGQLNLTSNPNDPDAVTIIEKNVAMIAGGVNLAGAGHSELGSAIIRSNIAFLYGGGINVHAVSASVQMRGISMIDNRALVGGGVSAITLNDFLVTSEDNGRRTLIQENVALVGGGLYVQLGADLPIEIDVENTDFISNKVFSPMDESLIDHLGLEGIVAGFRPTDFVPIVTMESYASSVEAAGNLFEVLATVPPGEGGGFAVDLRNVLLTTYVEFALKNITFRDNEAVVGGAASIHFTDLLWAQGEFRTCFPSSHGFDPCQRFYFINVTVHGNRAEYGGGIYTTHPDHILAACSTADLNVANSVESVLKNEMRLTGKQNAAVDTKCLSIFGNSLIDGTNEDMAADVCSSVKELVIDGRHKVDTLKTVASGEPLEVECMDEQDCDKELVVLVKDAFGQTISRGVADAELELSLISEHIIGDTRYTAKNGKAVINNTQAREVGISSQLTIQADRLPEIKVSLNISTRECYPGEEERGHLCSPCPIESYGLNITKGSCRGCESNAICPGGAALVPIAGYWHSNPFSPQMHRCIHREACNFANRTERLEAYYKDLKQVADALAKLDDFVGNGSRSLKPIFSDYHQCNDGFKGVLCGTCSNGYGHGLSGSCERCPNKRAMASLFLLLSVFWTFVLIGANCVMVLMSSQARIQLAKYEADDCRTNEQHRVLRRTSRHIGESSSLTDSVNREGLAPGPSGVSNPETRELLRHQLVATVQLAETFKVLVNYLQVTIMAGRLSVDWNSGMNAMLVGGVSEAVSAPLECTLSCTNGMPRSIFGLWLRVGVPLFVLWFLLLLYALVRLWKQYEVTKRAMDAESSRANRLATGSIVILIVAVYFSYIDNVREFVRTLNCVKVDEELGYADNPYQAYAIETGRRVWAEDPALTCFQGDHLITGIVGIIGLLLAFGVILAIVFLPILHPANSLDSEFVARYWFIYQAYRKQGFVRTWEAAVLIRKALIASILVFSFKLGASLQASLCLGVLIIAQMMHLAVQPFKIPESHEYIPAYAGSILSFLGARKLAVGWIEVNNELSLNFLESSSLFASILVYYAAIILGNDNATEQGRQAIVFFAFSVNALFVAYMGYRLYCGVHVLLDLKLETKNAEYMAIHSNSLSPIQLFNKSLLFISTRLSALDEDVSSAPIGSEAC